MARDTTIIGAPITASGAAPELRELIQRHQENNHAFYGGNPLLNKWKHDEEVTLHGGFDISARGWDALEKGLSFASGRLSEGQMEYTPLGGRIVGDMAYLAGVEEGTVRLDAGERQPMKLRVTTIFQRVDGSWLCVHRHGEMVR